jgi:hypothetical protein
MALMNPTRREKNSGDGAFYSTFRVHLLGTPSFALGRRSKKLDARSSELGRWKFLLGVPGS